MVEATHPMLRLVKITRAQLFHEVNQYILLMFSYNFG